MARTKRIIGSDECIWVNEKVRIRRIDPVNIVIERYRMSDEGNESWPAVGFYPSVLVAAETLATRHMYLLIDEQGDLRDLAASIRELTETFKRAYAPAP